MTETRDDSVLDEDSAILKRKINQKLVESGEKERLKEMLRVKLIECGWKDEVKLHCKQVVKERGVENVTVDDLIGAVTPKARATVPDSVKRDLLQNVRAFLAQQMGD